jgi:hypothetical protein
MDHRSHEPGTVADCGDCQALALEPGWYKALRDERVTGLPPDAFLIPEMGEQPVETGAPEPARVEVALPDLERALPDDSA